MSSQEIAEELRVILSVFQELQQALEGDDANAIRKIMDDLNTKITKVEEQIKATPPSDEQKSSLEQIQHIRTVFVSVWLDYITRMALLSIRDSANRLVKTATEICDRNEEVK